MRTLLYRTLILLAVFGLIFTPPVCTGQAELHRAQAAMDAQEYHLAAEQYQRAARFLSWESGLWEQAAIASFLTGEHQNSIILFEKASRNSSLSANGWDLFGQAYWWSGDRESARETWLKGLEEHPSHGKFFSNLSKVYFVQGNMSAERAALEHWVVSDGESDAASHYRLAALLTLAEPDRALSEFLLASSLDPEYDSAVETMRTTLNLASLETDQSGYFVVVGRGLGLVGEWKIAQQAFRQAVSVDGENAEAWAWLGEAEQRLGRDGRAALERALKFGRENPIVRSLRGVYWARQGKYAQALAEYLLAAEYDPENPVWEYQIGEMYAQLGDLPPALWHYQRATEIAPDDPAAWRFLALFCAQYGVAVEEIGLPAAQMALELTDEDPLSLDALGWSLAVLGRHDEARDALERALTLDPDFAQAHLHLAVVLIRLEEWASVRAHLQTARDLSPDGSIGEQAQMLLNQYFP
ncbi:MAG: hypothetical protein Kow002_11820 [Anaerolineales bacterium]